MAQDINFYLEQRYPIALYPARDGGYVAEIQELKGCMTQGETIEEAIAEIEDAQRLWIESAIEHDDPIPLPSQPKDRAGLKRYLLFAGSAFYASGGWRDFVCSFNTLNEVKTKGEELEKGNYDYWYHVIDSHAAIEQNPEDQIVVQSEQQAYS